MASRISTSDRRRAARARPEATPADQALVAAFLERSWAEQGLSKSTLSSYGRDLDGLARWLQPHGIGLLQAGREQLFGYLAERGAQQYAARSNARLLSSLRAFYAMQVRLGAITEDPAARLESPKLGRSLPKALSESEVEALLRAPELDTPSGLRDRAMVELMYAAGLRVSELVLLPATAVNLRQGVLRVRGKGNKERLVPMGEEAQHWLERYLADARPELVGKRQREALFLSRSAEPLSRQQFWSTVKQLAVRAGIDAARVSPHGLRHSFATHLLERKVDIRVIQVLLGHAKLENTALYTRVATKTIQQVMSPLDHIALKLKEMRSPT